MLRDHGDSRVQTHINQVIKTLEKHVKMNLEDPQLVNLHEKYARMSLGKSQIIVPSELLTLSSNGVCLMLKELVINKYLVSKEEVFSIFRFASQGDKNLNKKQFMTFILNLARVMLSRPPHNVPLDECLNLFIVKYLPKRIPTLRPIRPAPSARPHLLEHSSIFQLTSEHPNPPTMQHFSPLLRPLVSASSRESRSFLRPLPK
jgi:hypothetical protein